MRIPASLWLALGGCAVFLAILRPAPMADPGNLIDDPSFEIPKDRDQYGHVFEKWAGWNYEGDCGFGVGQVAHSGKTSGLMECGSFGKIRLAQTRDLEAGRYRITAYIRGLDIGIGLFNQTTEFMFNEKYMMLDKFGTFGWMRLTYVADLPKPAKTGPSFGLMAPGMLWIDDVSMERVGNEVKLTGAPVLSAEESPIAAPGPMSAAGAGEVRCPRCGYRNLTRWEKCYACGTRLEAGPARGDLPAVKSITSFEQGNPFSAGSVVPAHATDGAKALRIDRSYVTMQAAQDWSGFEYLKADVYTDSQEPLAVTIEIWDSGTRDYWTRVNYPTVVPPGASTLTLPLNLLYVGEKSRPGRKLMLPAIARLVFALSDHAQAPLFVDNIRVEHDTTRAKAFFDGLYAFDFGLLNSPVMDGFLPVTPATAYSKGRGYGLANAKFWKAMDVLEPDPLYEDFITIESGSFVVGVPNGTYRVFLNMDSPAGFWGESQLYRRRALLAQGKPVAVDKLDFESFQKKYFRFWDTEDLPSDNTFDKYQRAFFSEKTFDVQVKNGQLNLGFEGQNWACAVSAVIVFPVEKAEEGARFLDWVRERRRSYFDNSFKRVLHRAEPGSPLPNGDAQRGYAVFQRDFMKDVYYNDAPAAGETGQPLAVDGFAGQNVPVTMAVRPIQELGKGTVTVSALMGPSNAIPATAIDVGYVSYRITRVTQDGTVYALKPRLILPLNSVEMPKDVTRSFWLTVHIPAAAPPGVYAGQVAFTPQHGEALSVPLRVTVRKGTLDATDLPAGPFGFSVGTPWYYEDPKAAAFDSAMTDKSLHAMRGYGFTMFSGIPSIAYSGFSNGKPVLDFSRADKQMQNARELGFLAISGYGAGIRGIDPYHRDQAKMAAAGFRDYSAFIRAIYTAVERHAEEKNWLPVYWNLGDEPMGDAIRESVENAKAYRAAFPSGPPFFTAATSQYNQNWNDPLYLFAKALHVATWNIHDEAGVGKLLADGGSWAFYNGGDRWTYGIYLYKAAKEFHLKYRIAWHWHAAAGNPYYALDGREDDYAWANATPDGRLVTSVEMARIAAGVDDYRHLLTLARLAKAKAGTPVAESGEALIRTRMAAFHLGQRDHDRLFGADDWTQYRRQLADVIEALQP